MAYKIIVLPLAKRQFEKLPRFIQRQIEEQIDDLAENPRPFGLKKMKGTDKTYRIRVGNYRIIYRIEDNELLVLVLKIGHRKDIYQ